MSKMMERVTDAIVGAIIDAGGTIDYRPQLIARAAIAAMREPTAEMVDAGWQHTADPCWEENVAAAWGAMIDAALKD